MDIITNISLSPEAAELVLKHWKEEDSNNLSNLKYISTFHYVTAYSNPDGSPIEGATLGYTVTRSAIDFWTSKDKRFAAFDNGEKYYAVIFEDEYEPTKLYTIEFFDDVIYLLSSNHRSSRSTNPSLPYS